MCTPSPCIPAWLSEKHPEVLLTTEDGRQAYHNGHRLIGSLSNPIYQKYVKRITTELAKRYGRDKRIWGWQIGNEPHIQGHFDYSNSSELAFRGWLKDKYGSIDKLNERWGTCILELYF